MYFKYSISITCISITATLCIMTYIAPLHKALVHNVRPAKSRRVYNRKSERQHYR